MIDETHLRKIRIRRRAAAEKYKPARVRLLLVAEAPPREDDRYFYFEDVTTHDYLFREVTQALLGQTPPRSEKGTGLAKLRAAGVFLIDLKLDPVDGTDLKDYVPDLVSRCRALNPDHIILIKVGVFDVAYEALRAAGLPVVKKRISFPSTGQQPQFRTQFAEALRSLDDFQAKDFDPAST